MRSVILAGLFALSSCAPNFSPDVASRAANTELPPMKVFSTISNKAPKRSNRDIARDFLDLTFQLESGRKIPYMTRFEGPIKVRMTGDAVPSSVNRDLDTLLRRLRNEARIDITRSPANVANAQINIEVISTKELRRVVPNAACFVVPGVSSWSEYRAARRSGVLDWTRLKTRDRIAVFLPGDTSPQEMRDCLHEEVAQGLGPLNDLYRLPDSTFNDDNFHTVLTGFDMLILRATYAPELRSGMTRAQVAAALPSILARLNPSGENVSPRPASSTPRSWSQAVQRALGPSMAAAQRRQAAEAALNIASKEGWTDARRAFSHFAKGRLHMGHDNDVAFEQFRMADSIYARIPGAELQRAHVGVHMAAFALTSGDGEAAVAWADLHLPVAQTSENAALLATLMMIKAEGLALQGRASAAQLVRVDSLGWARYGFGSDKEVKSRLKEIASLSPMTWRIGG
ncbi:DUF2927 domain-containing protein [Nereida sp. MMG025]|uniref:DUF2927 domain-containing protein n=1 Tax=Nereida sp. MMG025 TaxID=2909981 RepID=UPI001F1ED410|nr:DUF2927 domain-containing protein [Nereida sp. MMG025]MCF6443555.1 DUF2927 domain-containing protein [Nereida sp. MMG025]